MKLLIITGGSRGLGVALCEQFQAKGYEILEFSRSAPHEYSVPVDLAYPEQSRLTVKNAIASFDISQLEDLIVISNAGMLSPIGQTAIKDPADIIANMNSNFVSAVLFMTEVIAKFQLAACRKVIANISSGAALKGRAGWSLYCAAKAGMENFIHSLAVEQESQPQPFIPINIDPGLIDTEMQALIRSTTESDFPELERFVQRKEQGLLLHPEQVASAILRILELQSLSFGARYQTSDHGG